MIERHVQTIFCDDIRQEVYGKLSFIGVYSNRMYVKHFPVTLPKLCLAVKVVTMSARPLRELVVRVLKDEEILQEIEVDDEKLATASQRFDDLPEEQRNKRGQFAQFLLVFSPLKIEQPCTLKVRVQTEDGELHGIGLKVEQNPAT